VTAVLGTFSGQAKAWAGAIASKVQSHAFAWEGVRRRLRLAVKRIVAMIFSLVALAASLVAQTESIQLSHAGPDPFTGRVIVVLSKKEIGAGVHSQNWFAPEPFFAQDVTAWPPHKALPFRPTASFPGPMSDLKAGPYFAQLILDRNLGGQNPLTSPGNLYSKAAKIEVDPIKPAEIRLHADQIVPEKKFAETQRVKLFEWESPLLTKFHGQPAKLRAGVVLPKSYAENPDRKYPVVYEIPGFGGNHFVALGATSRAFGDVEMVNVILDPSCRRGHHVFADSANNGPVGAALTREFIPALEKQFRGTGQRFVGGHSSGGWSSLWLQVAYPDLFDGVWATAPDPVDFRDFQRVNIYEKDANIFRDEKGEPRPLARRDGKVVLLYQPFSDMEVVFGRGGQLFSFEAVFSPRGADGEPLKLWDRATGAIDPAVAASWRAYDIRLILEQNWPALSPKLKGKLHVVMGSEDTFYLEGATRLLKESLGKLGSDAVVEIVPGKNHGNLVDTKMRQRIGQEMAARVKS
jgi:pimeloyl-ACP methyl ester carboxylesterase